MNYKMMGRFFGLFVAVEAVVLLPALGISLSYGETAAIRGFLWTFAIMALLGGILFGLCRKAGRIFGAREGMVCVGISWVILSILGCLPFVISGAIPRFIDAFFEVVSGFTTTGASILSDVEALPRGLLYWRSFTNWLGGMGVLVFLLAIIPVSGGERGFTMHLLRAESPGPDVGKLVPKMRHTAIILYGIYVALTVICFLFLLFGKMNPLDALCTAMSTAGTGGFGVRNDSLASFSPYIQNVCTIFMFLFGVNFSCYYLLLLRQFRGVFRDEELRMYVLLAAASIVLITWNVRHLYGTLGETVRHAAFQVSSIMTTTGFATTDFDLWPSFSKSILMMLMVVGGSAGSTSGGLKCIRVLLLFKILRRNIRLLMNPRKVQVVRSNGKAMSEKILDNVNAYLAAYVIILIISILLISLDGFSTGTNVTAVLSCFNNIGPGLEAVGPTCNFSGFSDFSKLVLIVDMLAGRLEIFPMLVLITRSTWKRK